MERNMTSRTLAIIMAALMAASTPVLAQSGAGGAAANSGSGGAAVGTSGLNTGATPTTQNLQNPEAVANNAATNKAVTGVTTAPADAALGAVSAPGVGVGHAADGLPIGSSGSGPGSPERPIDSGSR
jgi:hypothetical protein